VFGLQSGFERVDLRWFERKVYEKFDCLDQVKDGKIWVKSL